MSTRWEIKERDRRESSLVRHLELLPITLQILSARGIQTQEAIGQFLNAGPLDLADPFLLPGMKQACGCVMEAIAGRDLIMIHGDYDVDGVSASAIMVHVLKQLGAQFITYIPDRKSGYGFNKEGLQFAEKNHAKLIITLDCGITAHEEVAWAKRLGMDTIIVDHHQIPSDGPPEARAIINPWLDPASRDSFLELSAAGLAFKFAAALLGEEANGWMGLAALGTVADVAPLVGENRIIVKHGLRLLENSPHPGLQALIKAARLETRPLTARHIGFVIGPRLNAGGRMDTARDALDILITDSTLDANRLATILEGRNSDRRSTEKRMLKEAFEKCEREINFNRERVIVLWSESWHPGVIGIIAARLVDRFYRPAVVISLQGEKGKGSGRSIRHFNLHHALEAVSHELLEYGGHEFAAGFSIAVDRLLYFRKAINEYAHGMLAQNQLLRPVDIDAEISLADISEPLVRQLSRLEPFGCGNPEPVFVTRQLRLKRPPSPRGKFSSRMWVTDGARVFEAVGKNELLEKVDLNDSFDLVYALDLNCWQGQALITLEVKDIKSAS